MEEYIQIRKFYAGRTCKRTGVAHIEHIDQGLRILDDLNAPQDTKRAWCLHPLAQAVTSGSDRKDKNVGAYLLGRWRNRVAATRAFDYALSADQVLSRDPLHRFDNIVKPTLASTYMMLVADKIQNYHHFESEWDSFDPQDRYRLSTYFDRWHDVLSLNPDQVGYYTALLKKTYPLNHYADDFHSARDYLLARKATMLGFELDDFERTPIGVVMTVTDKLSKYHAFYLYSSHRGSGEYEKWWHSAGRPTIITVNDCNLVPFLTKKGIPHVCLY